jgi:PilZ domain
MTYFPQPNPSKRARRVRLPGSVVVSVRSEGSQPVRAKLHELSATGGLLILSKAFEQGAFVEVAFQTSQGPVHGMAELLLPRRESTSGCLQPFRFVALDDEDHTRLRRALESLLDQNMVGVPSSKHPSL